MLKRFCFLTVAIFASIFSATLKGDETAKLYFPSTLGSYWVYEDQNGDELTRQVVEGEEISGVTYHGFNYDPELEDWADFNRHFVPYLFHVGDEWISCLVGEEAENAVEVRLNREMDTFAELTQNVIDSNTPPELNVAVSLSYDVEATATAEEHSFLLPLDVAPHEEWDSFKINVTISFNIKIDIEGLPDSQSIPEPPAIKLNVDIQETGIILGTETVDVAAGTFEDCLKIQFQTETELTASEPSPIHEQPGESVTTIWLAPDVGIVKFHQESEKILLNIISADPDFSEAALLEQSDIAALLAPTVLSYELQRYEIAPEEAPAESDEK